MTNSTKKKQTLHISLQVIDNPDAGEPIAKFHADYSDCKVVQVYDVYDDEEIAEEPDDIQTPAAVADDVLFRFKADDVDVTYDSTCHFLCRGTKCIVPATPDGACPAATH